MRVSLVVAVGRGDVIGVGNGLPWKLPDDLRRFKALTMVKPLLMGRKTFDSIGKALPGRANLLLTRDPAFAAPGVVPVHSLEEALEKAAGASELMVIGGAEAYRAALPLASRMYMTRVAADVAGDTFFPPWSRDEWRESSRESHAADEQHAFAFEFVTLDRAV